VYGHGRGDALLRQVADRLRLAAAAESAHVSRIGGDEFAVLLERESQVFAQDFAQRLLNSVSAPYLLPRSEDHTGEVRGDRRGDYREDRGVDGIEVCVGVSIGVAHADPRKRNAEAILNLADDALYIAKSRGKSRFHIAEHDVPANPDTAPLAASAA
jgi:GGDEF domain-containing protein